MLGKLMRAGKLLKDMFKTQLACGSTHQGSATLMLIQHRDLVSHYPFCLLAALDAEKCISQTPAHEDSCGCQLAVCISCWLTLQCTNGVGAKRSDVQQEGQMYWPGLEGMFCECQVASVQCSAE